jgi:hypothetical protein
LEDKAKQIKKDASKQLQKTLESAKQKIKKAK